MSDYARISLRYPVDFALVCTCGGESIGTLDGYTALCPHCGFMWEVPEIHPRKVVTEPPPSNDGDPFCGIENDFDDP